MFKKIYFNARNYKFKHNHRRRYHTNHSYCWGRFQEEHNVDVENTVDTKNQDYKDECLEVLDLIFQHKNGKPLTRPFTDDPNSKQKSQNVSVKFYVEECKRVLEDINKASDTRPNDTISRSKLSINSNVYEDNFVGGSKQRQNRPEINGISNENVPQVKTDSSPILDQNINKNEKPTHRYRITQSSKPGSISKRRVIINTVKRLKVNNTQTKSKPQSIKLDYTKSSFNFNSGENMSTCPQPIKSETSINCNCKSSSDDDDEDGEMRVRVNRRLQSEKPSIPHNSKTVTSHHTFFACTPTHNISQTANQLQSSSRPLKSSLVIPKNPKPLKELWNSENKEELNMTFEEVLEEPIFFENSEDDNYGETLYERMFSNKLKEPNGRWLIYQFYIPPALVEVFYQKFTDDLTSQECLQQVCLARKWPEPVYTLDQQVEQSGPNQFLYSCTLKSVKFVPAKFASDKHLAKEVAASYCLRWLGLKQRKMDTKFSEFVVETYFNDMLYRY